MRAWMIVVLSMWVAAGTALAQVSVGPSSKRVRMGQAKSDPAKEKRRMAERFVELVAEADGHIQNSKWRRAREALDRARAVVTDRKADVPKLQRRYVKLEQEGAR